MKRIRILFRMGIPIFYDVSDLPPCTPKNGIELVLEDRICKSIVWNAQKITFSELKEKYNF